MSYNIDHIFYINLDRRPDRREEIEGELSKYGLSEKSERFTAIDRPGKGIVGCTYSHLEVIKLAKERQYKNVLILEDDFQFINTKEVFESKLEHFFTEYKNKNKKYDVLMLAYLMCNYEETDDVIIRRVIEATTAAAYIIHEDYYQKLIDLYTIHAPLLEETMHHWIYANDQIWKQLQRVDNWYYFTDRIGKQRPGYSDNSEMYLEMPC